MKRSIDLSFIPRMARFALSLYRSTGIRFRVAVYMMFGVMAGLGVVLVRISNAASYLSDDPLTCMNCHVMTDAYATWKRGSHGRAAVCNDCHVPHTNPVAKAAFKAQDGLRHSAVFTLRAEPQVLRLSAGAKPVIQENCLRCHDDVLVMVRLAAVSERKCWDCHSMIHGTVHSLSASPEVLRPELPDAGLKWMKKGSDNEE